MTKAEWLNCANPSSMLDFLAEKASDRKLRLFGCACCRRIWHLFRDERSRNAVEMAERYADEEVNEEERQTAQEAALDAIPNGYGDWEDRTAAAADHHAVYAAYHVIGPIVCGKDWVPELVVQAISELRQAGVRSGCVEEQAEQCTLLRDLFAPFSRAKVKRTLLTWNDGALFKIARSIYEDRAFDRIPILADALEDAGCDNADILAHCRGPNVHVRGCWVVDLLLRKQ